MRRSITALLIALAVSLGMPAASSAQAGRSAMLNGQIVDASGRGSSGRTVELISEGMVVGMTTSSFDGHFSFAVGGSGAYVVRTIVNGHPAGIRVSVVKGQNPPMALLVLPSAVTSSAQIGAVISGGLSSLASLASVTLSTAAAQIVTNIQEEKDDEVLASPESKQDTVAVLNEIIRAITPAGTTPPVITFNQQTGQIVLPPAFTTPGVVVPGIPQGIISAITDVVSNVPTGSGPGH